MDDLTYELLAWIAAGNRVVRPREATADAEEEFRGVVFALSALRQAGLVAYQDGHVSRTASGVYLAVGPVSLTPEGEAALKRDAELGTRPPWSGTLPWRV
jgi:hypothetical protein